MGILLVFLPIILRPLYLPDQALRDLAGLLLLNNGNLSLLALLRLYCRTLIVMTVI